MDDRLGVDGWPTPWTRPAGRAVPATPVEEGAPAWWTGENTNQFLLEQGVVLP